MRSLEKVRGKPITRFRRIMAFARELADEDTKALPLLIVALARIVQSQAITDAISRFPKDCGTAAYSNDNLFFSDFAVLDKQGRTFREIAKEITRPRRMNLAKDIVIPQPWRPFRLKGAMKGLRTGGAWGAWTADPNHLVECWEPLRLGFVHGGNHSISAGILTASGSVLPGVAYDITPIYDHVYCDGRAFRRRHDKSVISYASTVEMAAVFEIGRLIVEFVNNPRA